MIYYTHQIFRYLQFDFIVTLTTIGIIAISYLGVGWRLRARQTTVNCVTGVFTFKQYQRYDYCFETISIISTSQLCSNERIQATAHRGRDQLRIALQVGLMCGIYILNSIMWNVTPYIEASKLVLPNDFKKTNNGRIDISEIGKKIKYFRWTNIAFTSTNSLQCAVSEFALDMPRGN